MKSVWRWSLRLGLAFLIVMVALMVGKDWLFRSFLEHRFERDTGLRTEIGDSKLGITSPVLHLQGLRLYNTEKFGGGLFLDLPELYVEYDPEALRRDELRIRRLRIDLRELHIVENAEGQTNIDTLREKLEDLQESDQLPVEFGGIGRLELTFTRIRHSRLGEPEREQVYSIGLEREVAEDLETPKDLTRFAIRILLKKGLQKWLLGPASPFE